MQTPSPAEKWRKIALYHRHRTATWASTHTLTHITWSHTLTQPSAPTKTRPHMLHRIYTALLHLHTMCTNTHAPVGRRRRSIIASTCRRLDSPTTPLYFIYRRTATTTTTAAGRRCGELSHCSMSHMTDCIFAYVTKCTPARAHVHAAAAGPTLRPQTLSSTKRRADFAAYIVVVQLYRARMT